MTHRDEDEEIIDSALDTLAWQRREIDRLSEKLKNIIREWDEPYYGDLEERCDRLFDKIEDARAALEKRQ